MNALRASSNAVPRPGGLNASLNSAAAGFVNALGMLDLEHAMQHVSPDVTLHCGLRMLASGKQQVRRILLGVLAFLNAISYHPTVTWAQDGVSVIEADITIEWDDGATFCLPVTMILRVKYDLIVDLRVYCYEPELPAHLAAPTGGHCDAANAVLDNRNVRRTPSPANHFMIDVGRPGQAVIRAMAARNVYIGRTWPAMPTWVRITVGTREDMAKFQQALEGALAA